jgi:hypothetical protein
MKGRAAIRTGFQEVIRRMDGIEKRQADLEKKLKEEIEELKGQILTLKGKGKEEGDQ